jgi:hypothetical protein
VLPWRATGPSAPLSNDATFVLALVLVLETLASVHKSLWLCDLCKELAFDAQLAIAKSCFSYNSFAVGALCRQFLESLRLGYSFEHEQEHEQPISQQTLVKLGTGPAEHTVEYEQDYGKCDWMDAGRLVPEGTTGLVEAQGFNPGFHTQKKRTALKERQVWNCLKPDMIPVEATPDADPFLRPFRARYLMVRPSQGWKPWPESSCPFGFGA